MIVNDGGDQSAVESLVKCYDGQYRNRLLLVHNHDSLGMEAASNIGIRASNSTYLVIHDDDDSWRPSFLAKMIGYLEDNRTVKNFGGVVCYAELVHEQIVGHSGHRSPRFARG